VRPDETRASIAFSFLNDPYPSTIAAEHVHASRQSLGVLARVSRAMWRLEQAERERTLALVSARAQGVSIRALASAAGLSPTRVHQIVTGAETGTLDAALGEPRPAGWSAHQDSAAGAESGPGDSAAGCLHDVVTWLGNCAQWLSDLHVQGRALEVELPFGDTVPVLVDVPGVVAILRCLAADVDELARGCEAAGPGRTVTPPATVTDGTRLSPQERAILIAYASGLTLQSAASRAGVKVGTAKEYLDRVKLKYRRAGRPANTKIELARRAREDGFMS
jgi:lambda repressor-like predicted transcriptional regulator